MSETIEQLVTPFARALQQAQNRPQEAEEGLDALQAQVRAQELLKPSVRRETLKALESQRSAIRAGFTAAVMAELQRQLVPLGVRIEFKVLKRRRSAKPAAPQEATPANAPESNLRAVGKREPSADAQPQEPPGGGFLRQAGGGS